MATDNTVLSAAVGTGDTVKDLAEATTGAKVQLVTPAYVSGGSANAWAFQQVDATHGLPVAVLGTVPVSGTFWQATQPVSGTVTANIGTGNLAGITGTVTVAGTGTFAVQAAQSGNWPVRAQDGAGNALTSATRGAQQALSVQIVDASGNQVTSFGGSGGTASNYGSAFPAAGTAAGFSDGTNMQGARVFDADTGAGAQYVLGASLRVSASGGSIEAKGLQTSANSIPVVIASDQGSFTLAATQSGTWNVGTVTTVTTCSTVTSLSQWAGNAIDTNSGVKSAGTLRVVLATDQPALTNKLLVTADPITFASAQPVTQSGTWTVQPGNTANTTPWLVTDTPATSGGLSAYSVISSGAANQDSAAIKGSAGQVYGYAFFNTTASARYVKLYNLASGATSASTPVLRVYVPAGGGANVDIPKGIAFGAGVCIRITTGAADSDTGACSANDVLANVWYK